MIDKQSFDGSQIQAGLDEACNFEPELTYLSLIAQGSDGFVVVNGSDWGLPAFDDTQISQILIVFNETADEFSGSDSATLRMALTAALAGMWAPCSGVMNCPFDQHVVGPARLVFHVHVPGWGFEEACIKFKTEGAETQFCGLEWLDLHGQSSKPYTFQIGVAEVKKKVKHAFALYIEVSQNAGQQVTRLIIDPEIEVDVGPS